MSYRSPRREKKLSGKKKVFEEKTENIPQWKMKYLWRNSKRAKHNRWGKKSIPRHIMINFKIKEKEIINVSRKKE